MVIKWKTDHHATKIDSYHSGNKRWNSMMMRLHQADLIQRPSWTTRRLILLEEKENEMGTKSALNKSRARWQGPFLDSPTTRNVLSGLCFYDHATDAQEPCCLARTHHRTGGGEGGREADRDRESSLCYCVCLFLSFKTRWYREEINCRSIFFFSAHVLVSPHIIQ